MATFKSDAQGFLVGELLDASRDTLRELGVHTELLRAIRTSLGSGGISTPRRASGPLGAPLVDWGPMAPSEARAAAARARARDASGRFVSMARGRSGGSSGGNGDAARDAGGRFVAGAPKAGGAAPDARAGAKAGPDGKAGLPRGGDSFAMTRAAGATAAGMAPTVDPTLRAGAEIAEVLSPMARGLSVVAARRKERRQEEKTQRRHLQLLAAIKDIGSKAAAGVGGLLGLGGGGGGGGGLPGLLKSLIPGGALAGGLAGGLAGRILPALARVGGPLAGLFAAGYGGWKAGGSIWESLSPDSKRAVSDVVGATVDIVKSAVATVSEKAVSLLDSAKTAATTVVEKAGGVWDSAKATAGAVVDKGREVAADVAAGYGAARSGKSAGAPRGTAEAVGRMGGGAVNWVLGATSKLFESGRAGAGAVSTGKGDRGGASYGTYQLSSKLGKVQDFLRKSGYASQFAGLEPGSPEFNARWKELAKSEPAFGAAQHDYMKTYHYDALSAKLKRDGLDMSGRGAAVQDEVWSTSVQFGGDTSLIGRALKGRDAKKMSDIEVIRAIQQYKIENNERLFASSSADVRAGTLNRAKRELAAYESMLGAGAAPVPPAAAGAPSVPSPVAPNTGGGQRVDAARPVVVVRPNVGQQVQDRGIAHTASGGIGG